MWSRTVIAATAVVVVIGGLGGCATADTSAGAPSPSPSTTEQVPVMPPGGEGPEPSEVATASGAYINYYDGAIADTVGIKVLFFHASWCPQCRALEEDITANAIPDGMTIFKVDFDNSGALRQQYGVTLQTTIVFVDDDGGMLTKGVLYEDTTLDALLDAAP